MFGRIKNAIYHVLRWSERYTKIDMVYLASGGFWVGLGQFFINALSLILIYIFANYLPKETYGIYQYALAIIGILSVFTLTGMNRAVAQATSRGEDGALRTTVRYQLRWNLVMWLATSIACTYYYLQGDPQLAIVLAILGFFAPLTAALLTYGPFLEGKRKFNLNAFFGIASTVIYIVGMSIVVLFSGQLILLAAAYAITAFIASVIFYYATVRIFNPPISDARDTITYGWKLTFIGFLGPIVTQIDKVIIASFWGAAELATYAIAIMMPNKITTSIKAWVGIGFPKFANRSPEELDATLNHRIFHGMAFGGLCAAAYMLVSPLIFTYLLPQYLDSIYYSQLLSVTLIFAIPNRYVSHLLEAHKLSRIIFTRSLLESALRIGLYFILGIWGGILGLIYAHIILSGAAIVINISAWRLRNKKIASSD